MRCKAKEKRAAINTQNRRTGLGSPQGEPISDLDRRTNALMGESLITGLPVANGEVGQEVTNLNSLIPIFWYVALLRIHTKYTIWALHRITILFSKGN